MFRRKTLLVLLAAAAVVGLLTGCGGGEPDYNGIYSQVRVERAEQKWLDEHPAPMPTSTFGGRRAN